MRAYERCTLRAGDLQQSPDAQKHGFKIMGPALAAEDVVIEGNFRRERLRDGFGLHVGDVTEHHGFVTEAILPQSLSCIFFLEGRIDLKIGDKPFTAGGPEGHPPEGLIIPHTEYERFRRCSVDGQRVRHAVLTLSPEWLDVEGLGFFADGAAGARFARDHLACRRWALSSKAISLVNQLIAPPQLPPVLRALYLESRAIELVVDALCASIGSQAAPPHVALFGTQEEARLEAAIGYIEQHMDEAISLETISRAAGVSTSVLQRLFRARYETGVYDYIRGRKLARAYDALAGKHVSVAQAAYLAGYTSPANFSTAFKRQYGTSPSAISRGRA